MALEASKSVPVEMGHGSRCDSVTQQLLAEASELVQVQKYMAHGNWSLAVTVNSLIENNHTRLHLMSVISQEW
ncbi:hypothetical protein NC651_035951 [Populus alba x Populus x berolinensis]|nr:hypothetical protein NC651_035951 [Populus alba x Populus x berolinensis]